MKANGRRRWRKARAPHAKVRTFYGPKTKREEEEGPVCRIAAFIRRHRFTMKADGKTAAQWYPSPLPAKPFTARSLVGMSQGARKRRARLADARVDRALNKIFGPMTVDSREHSERARYRIGERLRPCPWGCTGAERCPGSFGTIGGKEVPDCKGAGVLPARGRGER